MGEVPSARQKRLRRQIQVRIQAFMDGGERFGCDYRELAVDAMHVLVEEFVQLASCIVEPVDRQKFVKQLLDQVPDAVELAHRSALEREGIGSASLK